MKKIYTTAALAAALSMAAVSCQVENDDFSVNGGGASTLTISPAVSDVVAVDRMTKGTLINWDRTNHANIDFPTDSTFFVTAVDGSGTFIPAWAEVKYFKDELGETGLYRNMWKPADGDGKIIEYNWKPGDTKTFYAYANLGDCGTASVTTDAGTGSATGMSVEYEVPESAASQADLLLGYYSGIGDGEVTGKTNGTAKIVFNHALTSVVVKLGTVKGAATFKVTGLALEGIYAGGTGVMTPASAAEEDPADRVAWTPDENGGKPVTASFSQDVAWSESTPPAKGDELGEPFIVIPQAFAADSEARLKVGIEIDGRPVDIYYPLKDGSWGAGTVNIYTVDYNGHEGIQLWEDGPYWATKNVGAEKPEDYGWYFAWGNVKGYVYKNLTLSVVDMYNAEFYPAEGGDCWANGFSSLESPGRDLKDNIPVSPANDAAQANMGIKWRMPTKAECEGLIANTIMTYITRNGVKGFLFTGTQTGYTRRSIFIPASGFAQGGQVVYITKAAYLRTSTWSGGDSGRGYSLSLGFNSDGASIELQDDRSYKEVAEDLNYGGRVIRAVENTEYIENSGN